MCNERTELLRGEKEWPDAPLTGTGRCIVPLRGTKSSSAIARDQRFTRRAAEPPFPEFPLEPGLPGAPAAPPVGKMPGNGQSLLAAKLGEAMPPGLGGLLPGL